MKSREGDRSSAYILSGFAAIWICIALATLPKIYGPVILPDEFGYWAQAAAMAGFDWTEVVGQFSWYSYGYGLVMFPFLKFISDPVVMYRCMIGINFCLMWAGSLLLYKTAAKIFSAVESWKLALVSGSSMLYVSCVTYAQTTMTEALLTFLYLLLGYGMLCWFEKPGLQRSILPILTAGYMYMVHLRTIGIVLGTAVCMVFGILFRNKSSAGWKRAFRIILVLCGIAALCCAAGLVKGTLIDRVSSISMHRSPGAMITADSGKKYFFYSAWKESGISSQGLRESFFIWDAPALGCTTGEWPFCFGRERSWQRRWGGRLPACCKKAPGKNRQMNCLRRTG